MSEFTLELTYSERYNDYVSYREGAVPDEDGNYQGFETNLMLCKEEAKKRFNVSSNKVKVTISDREFSGSFSLLRAYEDQFYFLRGIESYTRHYMYTSAHEVVSKLFDEWDVIVLYINVEEIEDE